jgi:hypothetical protein
MNESAISPSPSLIAFTYISYVRERAVKWDRNVGMFNPFGSK